LHSKTSDVKKERKLQIVFYGIDNKTHGPQKSDNKTTTAKEKEKAKNRKPQR